MALNGVCSSSSSFGGKIQISSIKALWTQQIILLTDKPQNASKKLSILTININNFVVDSTKKKNKNFTENIA